MMWSLRIGAIRLLPGGETLRALAGLADPPAGAAASTPPAVRRAAHERLAQLVDDGSNRLRCRLRPTGILVGIDSGSRAVQGSDRLPRVLARIDDPATLATLATDGPSRPRAAVAAAAIDDPAQLHDLLPRVRGKDKSVYKLVKQKCDALAAAKREAEEYAARSPTCAHRSSGTARERMTPFTRRLWKHWRRDGERSPRGPNRRSSSVPSRHWSAAGKSSLHMSETLPSEPLHAPPSAR